MGKFFVAGVFLGAVATFGVMHYTQGEAFTKKELQVKVDEAGKRATNKAEKAAEQNLQNKLDEVAAKLAGTHQAALAEKDAAHATLAAAKTGADKALVGANSRLAALAAKNTDLTRRLRAATGAGRASGVSRELLSLRVGLLGSGVRLWRTLGEVSASLELAGSGWADVESIRKRAEALPALAADYAGKAKKAKTFLEANSASLGRDLGDLTQYRVGVRAADIKAVNGLIEKIQAAVEGMKSTSFPVAAEKNGWTDSGVYVKKDDIIQVRAQGKWKMIEHWPPAGPDGWKGGAQHKIAQNARAGSLIMKISISPNMSRAYLGRPITADRDGRVVFRMNDKTVTENGGKVSVSILCISPKSLAQAVAAWRRLVGK